MLGIGSVFASRWKALFWAAGILLTVWSVVPSQGDGKLSPEDEKAAAAAVQALDGLGKEPVPVE